jgi:replicative DNA helicase
MNTQPGGNPTNRATVDLEWAVVGGIAAGGAFTASEVRKTGLRADHFNDPLLAVAYNTLLDLSEQFGEIDKPALRREMGRRIRDLELPGMTADEFMTIAYDPAYSRRMALKHASTLKDRALLISARREVEDLSRQGADWDGPAADYVAEAQRRMLSLSPESASSRPSKIADLMEEFRSRFITEYDSPHGLRGLPTGFPTIDRMTRGLCSGELIIIAGKTGGGKSAFAANVAVNAARLSGAAPVLFSLEMQWGEMIERMVFSEARVSSENYREKRLTPEEWDRLDNAMERLSGLNLTIHDDASLTTARILSLARQARFEGRCDLVIVDYTQLVNLPDDGRGGRTARAESREREVAQIVHSLQKMAMELSIPVIALSQLNDDGQVRESRAIKHFANVMLVLECKEDPTGEAFPRKEIHEYDCIVDKCRAGRRGPVPLAYHPVFTRFDEEARDARF